MHKALRSTGLYVFDGAHTRPWRENDAARQGQSAALSIITGPTREESWTERTVRLPYC